MRLVLVIITICCASTVCAETITCPEKIETREEFIAPKGGTWTPLVQDLPRLLMNVEFYEGDPQRMIQLAPDRHTKKKRKEITTWQFGKEFKEQITLVCTYDGTNYGLSMKLPAKTSKCVVTSDPEIRVAGMPIIERIECR